MFLKTRRWLGLQYRRKGRQWLSHQHGVRVGRRQLAFCVWSSRASLSLALGAGSGKSSSGLVIGPGSLRAGGVLFIVGVFEHRPVLGVILESLWLLVDCCLFEVPDGKGSLAMSRGAGGEVVACLYAWFTRVAVVST